MIKRGIYRMGVCCLLLLNILSNRTTYAQNKPALEYQVKAAFLFNFTKFIHWPVTAYASPDAPFVIGIIGEDPFGTYLDELVSGEIVDGHKIIVRRYPDGTDLNNCQLVFIRMGDQSRLKSVVSQLGHQNIFSVSDDEGFIRLGGILHFYMEDNKVKMEINRNAAKAAQLEISAKLLQIAKLK